MKNKSNVKDQIVSKTLTMLMVAMFAVTGCGQGQSSTTDPLVLGTILPSSGDLSTSGMPMVRAIDMAVSEIKRAGTDLQIIHRDSKTTPEGAIVAAEELIGENVAGIVGAAASSNSLAIIDRVVAEEMILISPSNTAPLFTDYADKGLYFRTAPSDVFQANALASLIRREGNIKRLGIVYRDDAYGRGLRNQLWEVLQETETEVVVSVDYGTNQITNPSAFAEQLQQIQEANLDGLVLISFEEVVDILKALIAGNQGPSDELAIYLTDGFVSNELGTLVDPNNPGVVDGIHAIAPSASPYNGEPTFEDRFRTFAPNIRDLTFTASSYDAVILLALASQQAGSVQSRVIADRIINITKGGEKCSLYEDCISLLERGMDIDYDGASGPLEFTDAGEPSGGSFDVFRYESGGMLIEKEKIVYNL